MTSHQEDLSIIIPAFREEKRLGQTLDRILAWRKDTPSWSPVEVLVVDDGSDDGTVDVAVSRGVRVMQLPENRGKGAAVRAGILATSGSRILITDADLSTPIEEVERLAPKLTDASIVMGSRSAPGAVLTQRQPFYRELMGKTFNRLIRLAGVRGFSDTQCGFKLLEGEVARELFSQIVTDGFAFDVEMVWLAQRSGYRVVEVGIEWENSPTSRVRPILDSAAMLLEMVRFRLAHARRR